MTNRLHLSPSVPPADPSSGSQQHGGSAYTHCSDKAPAAPAREPALRAQDMRVAHERQVMVLRYRQGVAAGLHPRAAAKAVGKSRATLDRWSRALEQDGLAGLMPNTTRSGRRPEIVATSEDVQALQRAYLVTNRARGAGSTREAARIALREGMISRDLAEAISDREQRGVEILPARLRRQVIVPEVVIATARSRTEADLDYYSCPGTMMWITDPITGEERFIRAGDVIEMDDATCNFSAVIPWEVGGCKCSDKYGVKVARWQWLCTIDAGSRYVPGYGYTARPKSSYRGEDVLSVLHMVFGEHGLWRHARFERGVFESHLVKDTLSDLGVNLMTVWSPHQKPFIEGLFNLAWTKLSTLPGQVGRFRGEMEAENKLLSSCQDGATDPRDHFPMLRPVITELDRVVMERNKQRVRSPNYGTWIPAERWQEQLAANPMNRVHPDAEWMFSPCARRWTVDGVNVGGSINIMPGFSLRFDFSAPWMAAWHRRKVRVHFDPQSPDCTATVVLDEETRDARAGTVLGLAEQVNKVARYGRRVIYGWEDDDAGLQARRAAAQYVRRELRAIRPDGTVGRRVTEARDGERMVRIDTSAATVPLDAGEHQTDQVIQRGLRHEPAPTRQRFVSAIEEALA